MILENNSVTELDDLYQEYWTIHAKMIDKNISPVAIAGVLVAQALTIYKTVLSEVEYESMCESIYNSKHIVKQLDPSQGHYH